MTIDNEKIAEIMQKSPTAEAFATYAACRERNVRDGISRLPAIRAQMAKEGFHPVPQDLLAMFRELERAGVGQLWKDQFKWNMPIKDVGAAFEAPKSETPRTQVAEVKPSAHIAPANNHNRRILTMSLGEGKEVSLSFTPNLSREDIRFVMQKALRLCGQV